MNDDDDGSKDALLGRMEVAEEGREDEREPGPAPRKRIARGWRSKLRRRDVVALSCMAVFIVLLSIYTVGSVLANQRSEEQGREEELARWIEEQAPLARRRILTNIGPAAGASDGLVIASPSRAERPNEPDYYYTWTRDSALTITSLLPDFLPAHYLQPWLARDASSNNATDSVGDPSLEPLLRAYVQSQAELQVVESRSGGFSSGGLSEPKFLVNGSAFDGDWGRPQRDGPALRALALIPYANFLLDRAFPSDLEYVRHRLYDPAHLRVEGASVIKNDLEEVAHHWQKDGFDLWEEVNGHHLFTRLVSLRALQAGSLLAERLADPGATSFYTQQASLLATSLSSFRQSPSGPWLAMLDYPDRTGLDCAFPLSVIHAGSSDWLDPIDADVVGTMRAFVGSFEGIYGINEGRRWTAGWAVGRYREDVYDGVGVSKANPWFICTFSTAEVFYRLATGLEQAADLHITNVSLPFWQDVFGSGSGRYERNCVPKVGVNRSSAGSGRCLEAAVRRVRSLGDAYMRVGRRYAGRDGRMSEQIDRNVGSMRGARDLTWSYASFLSAARARDAALGIERLGRRA